MSGLRHLGNISKFSFHIRASEPNATNKDKTGKFFSHSSACYVQIRDQIQTIDFYLKNNTDHNDLKLHGTVVKE
jgi:hypothetical protein